VIDILNNWLKLEFRFTSKLFESLSVSFLVESLAFRLKTKSGPDINRFWHNSSIASSTNTSKQLYSIYKSYYNYMAWIWNFSSRSFLLWQGLCKNRYHLARWNNQSLDLVKCSELTSFLVRMKFRLSQIACVFLFRCQSSKRYILISFYLSFQF